METENKDWKPKVGDVVWTFLRGDGMRLKAFKIKSFNRFAEDEKYALMEMDDTQWPIDLDSLFPTPEAALASIKIYDLEGKEVMIPRARPIFDGEHLHRFLRDEAGYTERLDSEIKWYSAEVPQKDPNEKTWENVVDAYSTFKEARMGHQEFYRYMDSQLDELVRSREYVHTMKMLHEGGGAAIGGKSDQREGGY